MCAGQTGGRVYLRVNDEWNLDREALERRKGKGAKVEIRDLDAEGVLDIQELLGALLRRAARPRARTTRPSASWRAGRGRRRPNFLMSIPEQQQTDPSISTE